MDHGRWQWDLRRSEVSRGDVDHDYSALDRQRVTISVREICRLAGLGVDFWIVAVEFSQQRIQSVEAADQFLALR